MHCLFGRGRMLTLAPFACTDFAVRRDAYTLRVVVFKKTYTTAGILLENNSIVDEIKMLSTTGI